MGSSVTGMAKCFLGRREEWEGSGGQDEACCAKIVSAFGVVGATVLP